MSAASAQGRRPVRQKSPSVPGLVVAQGSPLTCKQQHSAEGRGQTVEAEACTTMSDAGVDDDDMPAWVKDLDFLTEPLEGNKANFILQNSQRLRSYFEGRPGKFGQLFAIYDRHPPDTALDPQSGVLYFIRTEEGLQDKAISLKSVASGPSKHTWKMAWGRKTHLKKWGVLYKSYRCRHMFQPKSSPPPYRMQIYMLQDHDRDAAKGEKPTNGLALVQILSLSDAPLRRRSGMKRESEDIEGGDMDDDDQEDEKGHMLSPIPTGSSQLTASFASAASSQHQHKWRYCAAECSATSAACGGPSAVATLTTVPKTPGNVVAAPSTMSSVNSKLVTPAGSMPLDVAMSVRSATHTGHSSITSLTGHSPVTSLPHKPTPASGSSAGRIRAATGRSVVQRLDMNLIPSGELEDEEERACAAIQHDKANADAKLEQERNDEDFEREDVPYGRNPMDTVQNDKSNYCQQIMRGAILNQELATASLPRHIGILKQQYGAMAGPVLAEAVSGRAWGLVQVQGYSFGEVACAMGGDMTALGWAQLIRLYTARERDIALAADDDAAGAPHSGVQGRNDDDASAVADSKHESATTAPPAPPAPPNDSIAGKKDDDERAGGVDQGSHALQSSSLKQGSNSQDDSEVSAANCETGHATEGGANKEACGISMQQDQFWGGTVPYSHE